MGQNQKHTVTSLSSKRTASTNNNSSTPFKPSNLHSIMNLDLSQRFTSLDSDSIFYLVSYNPALFSDGINPGIGISRIVDADGKVLQEDDVSKKSSSRQNERSFDKNAVKLVLHSKTIVKVCSGRLHTHLLTHDGKILSFGSNNHGQLGCGKFGSIPTSYGVVPAVGDIENTFVVDAAGGGYHSIFLTLDHRVFTVGNNGGCQLGTNEFSQRAIPYEVVKSKFDHRTVIACSAGDSHSCFLTLCGHVYFAGSNSNGCCVGLKSLDRPLLLVNDLLRNEMPTLITCGYDNTVIVCQSGKVFGVGCNSCGQLAVKEQEHENFSDLRPVFFGKDDVTWASAGYFCSAIQTTSGDYYYAPASHKDMACLGSIFPKQHSIMSMHAGDYVLWVTNEMQENHERCGKIYGITSGAPTDITGEFCLTDTSTSVGISAQRDLFIIYFTGVPTHVMIARHFGHLSQIVCHVIGKGRYYSEDNNNLFSDITIVHAK
ncbi:hypothetical protein C9374_007213 [Naegleria lovaniensis]|uniref:Regulator of chromosome condensation n=1 Tax=Naegleria lovaniensis TaxID=51637 RepID=A0AA88KS01_NAELO|nr:uncharacterized protein C9374_007213 [Naegleria lovaniensis]KAG2393682.1 hypothetical protein C9374_007213 [Naegleria lovaniensis]